jgi:hypothetical protein
MGDERRVLALGLAIGAIVAITYCAIGFYFRPGGGLAAGLRDAYLHYQYAAAIAEGHPYSFNEGDPASTGNTSHLYPAVLSLFYLAGARGDALGVAAAGLGVAGFLASLVFVWLLARALAPRAAPLAVLLAALSGQLAISMFSQTDAVLFVPLALGSFTALVYQRRIALVSSLILLTLTRPEGFALALALLAAAALRPFRWDDGGRHHVGAASAAVVAAALALVANRLIAGSWFPQSIAGKGLVHDYGWIGAAFLAARETFDIFVDLVLGVGSDARRYYALPLVAGACAMVGLFTRVGGRSAGHFFDRWWLAAVLLAVPLAILAAVSGIQSDRHLAWILPVWWIYAAIGLDVIADRVATIPLRGPLTALLLLFQAVGSVYMASQFASQCALTGSNVRFAKQVDAMLPEGSRLGFASASGLAYFLPHHHVTNVNGITSPAFSHPYPNVVGAEILEHHPELRFDYWFVTEQTLRLAWFQPFVGERVMSEPRAVSGSDGFTLYRANWDSITGVENPLAKGVVAAIAGLRQVGTIDVASIPSEQAADYEVRTRVPGARIEPLLASGGLEGRWVTDAGRAVSGVESFRVAAGPSESLTMVMRTVSTGSAIVRNTMQVRAEQFSVRAPLELRVRVNGRTQVHRLPLVEDPRSIQEFAIELDRGDSAPSDRIEIEGDYISLGYWFYARDRATTPEGAPAEP